MKLGPRAKKAIPELIKALESDRMEVRGHAAIVLGMIGEEAQCAVPQLAQHLWDDEAAVRGSAARALDAITGVHLVPVRHKLDDQTDFPSLIPDTFLVGDIPFSKKAQDWWEAEGQHKDWSQKHSNCQPEARVRSLRNSRLCPTEARGYPANAAGGWLS